MTEIRNVAAELARFKQRVIVIGFVVLAAFGLLCSRLVYLQVVRHDDLAEQAESNRTAVLPVVPNRGQILDRNGIVLATNYSAYTLEITPSKGRCRMPPSTAWPKLMKSSSRATGAASSADARSRAVSTRCPCARA
jgi:cell division protein FtsI/penicillin-binding protein 2